MTRRRKILTRLAASFAGLVVIIVIAAVAILQSSWFANFAREKIIAAIEDSTGGVVDIGSFQFDWTHLTVRIRDFVLHGKEPAGSDPLARMALLEVRLKLLSGFKHMVDVRYVGIDQPAVNLIVFPDGTTNIPQPKVAQKPSQTSGLQTVVDLAIGRFQLQNGFIKFAQQKSAFSARGENLRALLNYDAASPSYKGFLAIDPLLLSSGTQPALNIRVNLPVTLEGDAVRVAGARISTASSRIDIDGSLENLNAPRIAAQLQASVSLPEMQQAFDLPIAPGRHGAPSTLDAQADLTFDEKTNVVQVRSTRLGIGRTTLDASGTMQLGSDSRVSFQSRFDLPELISLLKVSGVQAQGALQANGTARLDAHNNYAVDGKLGSRDISLRSGATQLPAISLDSPFHADPFLISLDGLNVRALGGDLAAKIFIEKLQNLSVEANLRGFSLPFLAQVFTGKTLGYDGAISGNVTARGDLNAKGTSGYTAQARLAIAPGHRGVPVSGFVLADYIGRTGAVNLGNSYLALPNSRLDISGSLDRRIDLNLVSHNLNDFLPAANFGAAKPESSLPIVLQGGTARISADVTGALAAPRITSEVSVGRFAIEGRSFDRFAAELAASPSGASIKNAVLARNTLQTHIDGSLALHDWSPQPASPLVANVTLQNGDVADVLALAGESSVPASGDLNAALHINGTYGNPLGNATLQLVNGSAYGQPIDRLYTNVVLSDQLITLSTLELAAAGGRMDANGSFRHPRDTFTTGHAQFHIATNSIQLSNIKPVQKSGPGIAGLIQLSADAAADLKTANGQSEVIVTNLSADLSARSLKVQNQNAGDLTATARTANGTVNYDVTSNFAGSNIQIDGHTGLTADYPTAADARISNLTVEKALAIAGQSSIPARGNLSANAHLAGTLKAPNANLDFELARANVYQETINRLRGTIQYSNRLIQIPSIQLDVPAGNVTLTGSFSHPANDYNAGALSLNLNSSDIQIAKIHHVAVMKPGLAGSLHLAADLSANVREKNGAPSLVISRLNSDMVANGIHVDQHSLGGLNFNARTTNGNLVYTLDSDLAKSQIHLAGKSQLSGNYVTSANLTFANVTYANLVPLIGADPDIRPGFDAVVEGTASLNGPVLQPDNLTSRLQLTHLEAQTLPQGSPTGGPPTRRVDFHNEGPITVDLKNSQVQIQQLHIIGPGTDISGSGGLNLKDEKAPISLKVLANADLGVLQDLDHDFYSSGGIDLNATIRGSFAKPLVNGRIELKNANVNYAAAPNGLSNANGVILLNGANANIQSLTAESGGGKISLAGFASIAGGVPNFNLKASASRVRVRYSGVSVTSDATLSLAGSIRRSLLNGTVTVDRIAYGSSSDAGSLLSGAATPPETPTAPSPLLGNMRLDIRILTAPSLRVLTTYADRLSVEANLTVRGTAATPGMLGFVKVTDGQLVFFGNTYTVNTGVINFYNPNAIVPVLNVSLETIAQNVDVTLGVTGPIDNLQLSYRSDPPLTFEQIVQLLATNSTPSDPTIAAQQPVAPHQSFSQMGESAILGQAIANPLASRVQRVFGLSQFKIDPAVSGANGQPSARVTLQQKIASNITFTYITDVTETNSQIIRIEWALSPALSAVGLRDFNGNVSVQMFYKFKVR